jgi:hypothetical protein
MLLTDNNLPGGEPSKPGIRDSLAEGWPVPAAAPFPAVGVSLDGVDVTGSRTDRKESYRLIGGNRVFPRFASVPTALPYITCLRAARYQYGLGLKIPWRAIPHHERDAVLEVKLARCAEPLRGAALYMRHRPGDREADLSLNQLPVRYGEEILVTSIGEYSQERFAYGYDQMKPRGLENTELRWSDGLKLRVDETDLRLNILRMKPFEGRLTMDADIEGRGRITLRKDVNGFSVRAYNHRLVESMMVDRKDVLLRYRESDGSRHTAMVSVPRLAEGAWANPVSFRDGVRLVSRPKGFEGEYRVEVTPRLIARILGRLARCGKHRYTNERGDIGEELIDAILSLSGSKQRMGHPLDPGREFDSSRKGPDSLRWSRRGGLVLFEFKWWGDPKAATSDARREVYSFSRGKILGEQVVGAYIAILDWKDWRACCTLNVSRVW